MRVAMLVGLVLAFVCFGLVRATRGTQPGGSGSVEGLFIPSADDAANSSDSWSNPESQSSGWSEGKRVGATPSRKLKPSSQNAASAGPEKTKQAASGADAAWLPELTQPWATVLITLGGLAVVFVPALLVGRWIRTSRAQRATDADRFSRAKRSRSSVPTVLAASLRHAHSHEEFTGAVHGEESKNTRRAA